MSASELALQRGKQTFFFACSHQAVFQRQKHPFLSPPVTTVPTERFHQMMQDVLRGSALASLPFYD